MSIVEEFKKFAMRGNLVELAIGFTVGATFNTVARSLVDDIIMPPLGLVIDQQEFRDMFVVLNDAGTASDFATLDQAQAAGAVTLNYGLFLNNVVTLLIIALAMFLLIRLINRFEEELLPARGPDEPAEPANKKCPFCLSTVAFRAVRCPHCTSELEVAPATPPT